MIIELFGFTKRSNSLSIPKGAGEKLDVKLKNETSKFSPSFYLSTIKPTWNYLKYDGLYYYIDDVITIRNNYYLINCSLDVLGSYRDDIHQTVGYVRFSSNHYNPMLPDTRLSIGNTIQTQSKGFPVFAPIQMNQHDAENDTGTYVVTYNTTQPTMGPVGVILLDEVNVVRLARALNDKGLIDSIMNKQVGELITKTVQNVYDMIISCIYIPHPLIQVQGRQIPLILNDYQTEAVGYAPNNQVYYRFAEIDIPKIWGDFRDLEPYSNYYFDLPGVGIVEYNSNLLINRTKIKVETYLDIMTGDLIYYIDNTTRVTGNIATNVSLSKMSVPGYVAGLGGAATAIGAAATGHFGIAAASLFGSVLSTSQVSTGALGGNNSNLNLFAKPADHQAGVIYLTEITHGTNFDPLLMTGRHGRPLNEVINFSELSGYAQMINASVVSSAPIEIKEQINNLLNGGVYFE